MPNVQTSIIRSAAVAALVSGLAFASPLHAAPADLSQPPNFATDQTPSTAKKIHHDEKMEHSPQAMAQRVEDRIKTLHSKLDITSTQEAKWSDVAQAMRDNEATISQLIQARHQNSENMTAVDDLQSYEKIAQAHADGIQKLIPAFETLYNDMSNDQKKDADEAFGRFEGHRGDMSGKKHG